MRCKKCGCAEFFKLYVQVGKGAPREYSACRFCGRKIRQRIANQAKPPMSSPRIDATFEEIL